MQIIVLFQYGNMSQTVRWLKRKASVRKTSFGPLLHATVTVQELTVDPAARVGAQELHQPCAVMLIVVRAVACFLEGVEALNQLGGRLIDGPIFGQSKKIVALTGNSS